MELQAKNGKQVVTIGHKELKGFALTVEDAALQAFTAMCEDVSGDWTKARDAIRKTEQLVRIIGQ